MAGGCSLCFRQPLRMRPYADSVSWAGVCPVHRVPVVVLNRPTDRPTTEERRQLESVFQEMFPDHGWRGPWDMPEHYHLHAATRE